MVPVDDKAIAQMRRGTIEYCVMALLKNGDRYGFDIVRELAEVDGMVTTEGTIYPLLSRLKRDGMVETTWQESTSGPPRKYYKLTRAGEKALVAFEKEWLTFRDAVEQLLGNGGKKK